MNRREMLRSLAGVSTVVATASTSREGRPHFGLLTVEGHRAHRAATGEDLHVYFNGDDVTASSYEANDREGYVKVFCRDQVAHRDWTAKGAIHVDHGGGACRLLLRGTVEIRPGSEGA